jgi:tetratricopeptide (TPR) repeat protein
MSMGRYSRVFLLALCLAAGCEPPVGELTAIPATDMSKLEVAVRNRIASAHAEFDRVASASPSRAALGAAYGELGMVYQAQDLPTPAEVAYRNARRLAPRDKRWPYLLAHLYADSSRLPEAIQTFEAVRAIDPEDAPTRIYLGQLYLQGGELDKAKASFEKAKESKDARAAALAGLGKTALAAGQYKEAAEDLEEALKLWPNASQLRHPLAMAYRGLGDAAKAQENLARHVVKGAEPGVVDPIVDEMSSRVVVSRVLLRRGQQYGRAGRFDLAEQSFRAAVASDPGSAEARANLGISLANVGKVQEAREQLIEAVRLDESNALARFSLAVVYDRLGDDRNARSQYLAALRRDPGHIEALVYLGDLQMRTDEPAQAAGHYRRALEAYGHSTRIEHSLAMALVKAGRRAEAKKTLEQSLAAEPGSAEVKNSLARLLATAAESNVRDAKRALALSEKLFQATRSLAVGQSYAMALAEAGRFKEATTLQQETIIGYQRSKTPVDAEFLQHNLRLYRQQKPAREGWSSRDPVFFPRSPAAALVATAS